MVEADAVAALDALLDAEALALRQGDLGALGALAIRKKDLEGQLAAALHAKGATAEGALNALVAKARRNEGRLRAAISGVRAARLRLSELRGMVDGMTTYDRDGRRNHHPFSPGQVTRRA